MKNRRHGWSESWACGFANLYLVVLFAPRFGTVRVSLHFLVGSGICASRRWASVPSFQCCKMINGFKLIGSCNCSGTKNYKYEKNGYIVYHVKKRQMYHIKYKNNYLVKNQPISTLCSQLVSLGLVESEECLSIN